MRVKLLDSQKLTTIENGWLIDRRNILVGSGLCAALVIGFPFLGSNEAFAQPPLIKALLKAIALARQIWMIFQPTEGRITVINTLDIYVEGAVFLGVLGPGGQEDAGY